MAIPHTRPTHPYSVAFDANAITRLCDETTFSRAVLHELRSRVKQRTTQVVATWSLISELSGLFPGKPTIYRRAMSELRDLSRSRVLRHWDRRVLIEVTRRTRLSRPEAFHSEAESAAVFHSGLTNNSVITAEDAAVRKAKARYEVAERQAKADVWKEAEGTNDREQWCKMFERDRESVIDDWCVYFVRMFAERQKRPVPHDLRACEVPTARADAAYHVTRLWLVGLEARGTGRIDGNDLYDNEHFADAAYSDVLVTDDKGFHRIASQAGNSGVRLERFEPWAESLLSRR